VASWERVCRERSNAMVGPRTPAGAQLVVALLLALMCGMAGGEPTTGGHFRSGSIAWHKLEGNEVEFEIQAEWRRSYEGHYKNGSPANSSIFVGDRINIQGANSPRLLFGDGAFNYLLSEVRTTARPFHPSHISCFPPTSHPFPLPSPPLVPSLLLSNTHPPLSSLSEMLASHNSSQGVCATSR
jgi:hypothetical protein